MSKIPISDSHYYYKLKAERHRNLTQYRHQSRECLDRAKQASELVKIFKNPSIIIATIEKKVFLTLQKPS